MINIRWFRPLPLSLVIAVAVAPRLQSEAAAPETPLPTASEVEDRCTSYIRDHLQSGFVRLRLAHMLPANGRSEFRYEMTFAGERLRRDWWWNREFGDGEWRGPQKLIITETEYIEVNGPGVSTTAAPVSDYDGPEGVRRQFGAFDPPLLGTNVSGLATWETEGQLLHRADRNNPTVSEESLDGLHTFRVNYVLERGSDVTVWYAPEQGYGVIAAEMKTKSPRGVALPSIRIERKQYPAGGVWYPLKMVIQHRMDGQLLEDRLVTVEDAKFGPVDEAAFTFARLGLQPGEQVLDRRNGPQVGAIWDGEKLLDSSVSRAGESSGTSPWPKRAIWILNAVVLMCLAIYFVRRAIIGRRGKT